MGSKKNKNKKNIGGVLTSSDPIASRDLQTFFDAIEENFEGVVAYSLEAGLELEYKKPERAFDSIVTKTKASQHLKTVAYNIFNLFTVGRVEASTKKGIPKTERERFSHEIHDNVIEKWFLKDKPDAEEEADAEPVKTPVEVSDPYADLSPQGKITDVLEGIFTHYVDPNLLQDLKIETEQRENPEVFGEHAYLGYTPTKEKLEMAQQRCQRLGEDKETRDRTISLGFSLLNAFGSATSMTDTLKKGIAAELCDAAIERVQTQLEKHAETHEKFAARLPV